VEQTPESFKHGDSWISGKLLSAEAGTALDHRAGPLLPEEATGVVGGLLFTAEGRGGLVDGNVRETRPLRPGTGSGHVGLRTQALTSGALSMSAEGTITVF
jgi:hypothetical protein